MPSQAAADPPIHRGPGRPRTKPHAGRPEKTEQKDAYTVIAKARAKRETYKAHLEEIRYKEAAGELVKADDARIQMATMLKATMLTLDTITEVVEREAKLTPEQADSLQRIIDRERRSLHAALTSDGPAI